MAVEIEIETGQGKVRASAPIGTSAGSHEASSVPAEFAVKKFALFRRSLRSNSYADQSEADEKIKSLDATPSFREIGGNLATALSAAFLKAFALESGQEIFEYVAKTYKTSLAMPRPISVVAGGWKGTSDIQEFHLMPVHQKSFADSMSKISNAYLALGDEIAKSDRTFRFSRNLESGWSTSMPTEDLLGILKDIAHDELLKVGADFAASHLWDGAHYVYSRRKLTTLEQIAFVEDLAKGFSMMYVEDPLREDDFMSFAALARKLKPRIVCGDDLYSTRANRLVYGADRKSTNAAVVKPNQVGTITDTAEFAREARRQGMSTVMSHRSAETDDALIAHLAVGLGCDFAKMGIAGERIIKLNELIRIEERMRGE
jgi:enolase